MNAQRERVLAALRAHPERGITAVDFIRFPTIDGGPPITRVAARIEELRSAGYRVDSGERRDKCVVYRLTVQAPPAAPVVPEGEVTGALFDLPSRAPSFDEVCPIKGEEAA